MKHHCYQVYKWTCKITNKSYIGYTGDGVLFRWGKHLLNARAGTDNFFYRAIRKHGAAAFCCQILFETDDRQKAQAAERDAIISYGTLAPNGYNCSHGGTGGNTWFGPNLEKRRHALSLAVAGLSNPNSSGVSDEQILNAAERFWLTHRNWRLGEWLQLCHNEGLPKHICKFRFAQWGGGLKGLKVALLQRLQENGENIDEVKYVRTSSHNHNVAKHLRGKIWVTGTVTRRSYRADVCELNKENIIKGRKC